MLQVSVCMYCNTHLYMLIVDEFVRLLNGANDIVVTSDVYWVGFAISNLSRSRRIHFCYLS